MLVPMKIKDLGRVVTGSTPPTSDSTLWGDDVPFVKPSDMRGGQRHIYETEKRLSSKGAQTSKGRVLPSGTTCVVCIGTIGKVCQLNEPAATNQQINSIIVDETKHNPDYVYYLMTQSIPYVEVVEGGSASGRQHVKKSTFEDIELNVLPRHLQDQVVSQLNPIEKLIENNARRIAILEEMAQAIYREWFVDFKYPGHESDSCSPSYLGELPLGWELKEFSDVCTPTYGHAFKSKLFNGVGEGTKVVRIRDVPKQDSQTYSTEHPKKAAQILADGDILIGMDGDFHMGKWAGGTAYLCQRVCKVAPLEGYSPYFVFLSLQRPIRDLNRAIVGTTVAHLGDKHLRDIKVVIPRPEILNKFNQVVDPILREELTLKVMNMNLASQRDQLLPKLISGKIELN